MHKSYTLCKYINSILKGLSNIKEIRSTECLWCIKPILYELIKKTYFLHKHNMAIKKTKNVIS